jgi:hypothetical protein
MVSRLCPESKVGARNLDVLGEFSGQAYAAVPGHDAIALAEEARGGH